MGGSFIYPTNPAAVILPIVERIAPERLAEVFWRAVALYPLIERDREELLRSPYIGYECMLLARYDRQVAGAVSAPIDSYLRSLAAGSGPRDEFDPGVIAAMGCIDVPSALSLVESLAPPGGTRRLDPAHQARLRLAEMLGMGPEERWMRLWRSVGAQLDD